MPIRPLRHLTPCCLLLSACATAPQPVTPATTPETAAATAPSGGVLPLEKTYWQLTSLHGQPVGPGSFGREAHLVLEPEQHRVGGSGGCNGIMGAYALENGELRISRLASTLMMCPQGMQTEHDFLQALPQTVRWEVVGHQLTLRDASGGELAAFTGRDKF